GAQLLEVRVIVPFQSARDSASVRLSVEHKLGSIPRVHEWTRFLRGDRDSGGYRQNANGDADHGVRCPSLVRRLDPDPLQLGDGNDHRLAFNGRYDRAVSK